MKRQVVYMNHGVSLPGTTLYINFEPYLVERVAGRHGRLDKLVCRRLRWWEQLLRRILGHWI